MGLGSTWRCRMVVYRQVVQDLAGLENLAGVPVNLL
jgi:hypothetical protein